GATRRGSQEALARVPPRQLAAPAAGVRDRSRRRCAARSPVDGFEPTGCDGARVGCPRSAEPEARLRPPGTKGAAPTGRVTAFVHPGTGLSWPRRLGPGGADERAHPVHLPATHPPAALIVADAAYMGYGLARAIPQARRSLLLRMSSKAHPSTAGHAPL